MCEHDIVLSGNYPVLRILCTKCGKEFHLKFICRLALNLPLFTFLYISSLISRKYDILVSTIVLVLACVIALIAHYYISISLIKGAIKKGIICRFIEENL